MICVNGERSSVRGVVKQQNIFMPAIQLKLEILHRPAAVVSDFEEYYIGLSSPFSTFRRKSTPKYLIHASVMKMNGPSERVSTKIGGDISDSFKIDNTYFCAC